MYDLNVPGDVIRQMRDGDMTDKAIVAVCRQVIDEIEQDKTLSSTILSVNNEDIQNRIKEVQDYPELYDNTEDEIEFLKGFKQDDYDLMADVISGYIFNSASWSEAMEEAIEEVRKTRLGASHDN